MQRMHAQTLVYALQEPAVVRALTRVELAKVTGIIYGVLREESKF